MEFGSIVSSSIAKFFKTYNIIFEVSGTVINTVQEILRG